MQTIASLLTATGLGIGAGVNAYATMFVFGVLARFYPTMFPGELAHAAASTPVLIVVGVMYAIEFIADKIPAVNHVWDAVHTFIRPLAGAAVAFASSSGDVPREIAIVAAVLGGGAALSSHLTKASVRAGSTVTTGGTANPLLSIVEDVFAIVQSFIAIFLPWMILVFLILFVLLLLAWRARRSRRESLP